MANLPYNVSVPVLLHLLALLPSLEHGLVMVQSEVADRMAAGPGSKVYGVPSVKLAWYADARRAAEGANAWGMFEMKTARRNATLIGCPDAMVMPKMIDSGTPSTTDPAVARHWFDVFEGAGLGYSGVAVVEDTLYTMGAVDDQELLIAVNVKDGTQRWSSVMGPLLENGWGDGPRGTPTGPSRGRWRRHSGDGWPTAPSSGCSITSSPTISTCWRPRPSFGSCCSTSGS